MSLARRARKYVQPISGLRSRRSPDYTSEDILIQAAPLSAALARRVASPAAPVSSARETSSFTSSPTASSTCYTSSSIVSSILGRPTVAVGLEMRGAGDVGCWAGPSTWSWRCGELAINWRCVSITRATLCQLPHRQLHRCIIWRELADGWRTIGRRGKLLYNSWLGLRAHWRYTGARKPPARPETQPAIEQQFSSPVC